MNFREKIKIAEKFVKEQQEQIDRNRGNAHYDDIDDIRQEAIETTTHLLKIIECLEYLGDIWEKGKE